MTVNYNGNEQEEGNVMTDCFTLSFVAPISYQGESTGVQIFSGSFKRMNLIVKESERMKSAKHKLGRDSAERLSLQVHDVDESVDEYDEDYCVE